VFYGFHINCEVLIVCENINYFLYVLGFFHVRLGKYATKKTKKFMFEEDIKWQKLLLQNKEVRGDKFSLFLRKIVAATIYIKPCFIFI
jgi:hypothetical protein